jgi:hypothetical protein
VELTNEELVALIGRVFAPGEGDRGLALLVDLPDPPGSRDGALPDRPAWRARRELAAGWRDRLAGSELGLAVALFAYPNVGSNNADLPAQMWPVAAGEALPADASALDPAAAVPTEEVFAGHSILLAPTELSATAPLKVAARRHGFRAATMPGFSPAMVPALRLDLEEVDRRVRRIAALLDDAEGAEVVFRVPSGGGDVGHRLFLDLRHRTAHVSSALLREPGTAGNLPSGEAYIVPYEGEEPGDPSRSAGVMPVELSAGGESDRTEVVLFRIEENRAVAVDSEGPVSAREADRLAREPARGNLEELGLGVLAGMGVEAIGSTLLDEKLGLHIAFGRSEHFGGTVGPGDFHDPREVIHLDHIYLPSLQPSIEVPSVDLIGPDGDRRPLMRNGEYV